MARFIDTDTGESQLHLVRVPEGVSIQMSNRDEITHGGANDYISVVLNRQAMRDLSDALREMADPPVNDGDEDCDDTNSGQCIHGVGFDEDCDGCQDNDPKC